MMKELSIFSKIMFGAVALLLIVTVVLGITTAVKASKGELGTIPTTPKPTQSADITGEPKPTGDAETTPEPSETPVPSKKIIAIDPGQQKSEDKDKEPVGPGATETVQKMSYGATSKTTKEREYIWTLKMAEVLKEELESRGYEVVLLRDSNDDVKISNAERAQKANEAGADLLIGLQLDGATNAPSASGMYVQIASEKNKYVTPDNIAEAQKLGKRIHDKLINKLEPNDRGVKAADDLALINWAKMPTVVVTLGFASNEAEDKKLQTTEYKQKIAGYISESIDDYFGIE